MQKLQAIQNQTPCTHVHVHSNKAKVACIPTEPSDSTPAKTWADKMYRYHTECRLIRQTTINSLETHQPNTDTLTGGGTAHAREKPVYATI